MAAAKKCNCLCRQDRILWLTFTLGRQLSILGSSDLIFDAQYLGKIGATDFLLVILTPYSLGFLDFRIKTSRSLMTDQSKYRGLSALPILFYCIIGPFTIVGRHENVNV